MAITKNNHYIPQWYQKSFMDEKVDQLCYYQHKVIKLPSGTYKNISKPKWNKTAQIFYKEHLYSTFFNSQISDEIERKLFGPIDENGAKAVRAFMCDDISEWHKNFQSFFIYIDAQKIRTPKGLDWIRSKYPSLSSNELMQEMQAIRALHCTLWSEGVRELVSAEDSDIKFIISDHPVTIYNYACPPDNEQCLYPNDPDIALKGSQTIFPLNKNRCLILTNLEYAKDPDNSNPLEKRTNSRKTRQSMVNTIEFINKRKLTSDEVEKINYIIKSRSNESIASGRLDWLDINNKNSYIWSELRKTTLPPSDELYRYGGEMYASYENGESYYQDSFGRTNPQNKYLLKNVDEKKLKRNDDCGCGSGKKYKKCCLSLEPEKRTSWTHLSIRERNLIFCNAIKNVLGLESGKTWDDVRKNISGEQIKKIYEIYGSLWPSDTDIYDLLPKPYNKSRGLYTGIIDIRTIGVNALGISPYFDELLIQNPILNPNTINRDFNPISEPNKSKYQAIKDFLFILNLEPYIYNGLINLIPDPCSFDNHLHREMLEIAQKRKSHSVLTEKEKKLFFSLMTEDVLNATYCKSKASRIEVIKYVFPDMPSNEIAHLIEALDVDEKTNQLVLLSETEFKNGGQFVPFCMAPNYEMSMFIAQATGSAIITDSESRWREFQTHEQLNIEINNSARDEIFDHEYSIKINYDINSILKQMHSDKCNTFKKLLEAINTKDHSYMQKEALNSFMYHFKKVMIDEKITHETRKMKLFAPENGFYDNNVLRLLLKSDCNQYLDKVNLAIHLFA